MPTDYPVSYGTLWSDVLSRSFQNLWEGLIATVPTIIFALVILLLGWIIALALEQVIARLLKALKLNELLERSGALEAFKRAHIGIDASKFIAALVRWFVFLVFLIAVADVLQLAAFNAFLRQVLLYIPNIIAAALILLVAAIAADLLDRLVSGAVRAGGFAYGSLVGSLARWSVFVFGIIAALQQLGIATALLQTLVTGLVAMIAIAGGLAFGMGGKDLASDVLEQFRRRLS
ncbi:MAG: hypothetical protein A2991_02155 [Candidatus Terrybacteria bacterium RIFCSPLOWO2_01_FULL_58_14]|uniref:Small-conductance mechanosensitive ion channel n=2 Tax=Candidatus Terryibacteriota TaxID=1817920 RepID=A0A1G2PZ85_9BACT|nr:MAG: hypothetical protein A2682_03055 [Candidatus Terrybacteria bacterium RIFCSPHIGHO2_01_FULL_58_15]OHA53638.1 MAG: hypothetical protein A2991_02155 [Candidatus Terrybacteria bacterium RIFCSPLOWO2_01_FULL_58_14]